MSEHSENLGEVNYRGQVEMTGWVMKNKQHFRGRQIRRFFRLKNSTLSNHPKINAPPTWEISVSKCIVKVDDGKCAVNVRLLNRQVRFSCDSINEAHAWARALRSASVCNISDFYKIGNQLGVGSFGTVRLGYDVLTKEKRAIKIIKKTSDAKEDEFQQREIDVILTVRHENIVQTFDIFDEEEYIYVVMEYLPGGDMFDYLAKRKVLPEYEAKTFIYQLLRALEYLHRRKIVHRDIKVENCLIASEDPLEVKLADFGFSRFIDTAPAKKVSSPTCVTLRSVVGTCYYIAPEILEGTGHGTPVDIFSSGVVMFRVLSGRLPFRGFTQSECFRLAKQNKADFSSSQWADISEDAVALCAAMLQADPEKRPSAQEALYHPWFMEDEEFMLMQHVREGRPEEPQSFRNLKGSLSFARESAYDDIPEPISSPFG